MRISIIFSLFLITSCASTEENASLLSPGPDVLKYRQMQTRSFDTLDEVKLLQAAAQVLQDLGFTITKSETRLGFIAADKDRNAKETGQIALNVAMVFLSGLTGHSQEIIYDDKQKIMLSLVATPVKDSKRINVRVNVARVVWDNRGQVSRRENVNDPEVFQEFFNKLGQSVFLTANEI